MAAIAGRSALALILLHYAVTSVSAVTLARGGRATVLVVVARDATLPERTAAAELASYLGKVSGAAFPIEPEPGVALEEPAIYVGATSFATSRGIDPRELGSEEWIIRSGDRGLILAGGRPRGTLYAVYRFLERHVGVRWWTPFEESVPRRRHLAIGEIDERGQPPFAYRDISGLDGPREFRARHFLNGGDADVPWDHGGKIGYASPWAVHTFYRLVPPEEFFASHPEYFSERGGFRAAGESQLCLTNPALRTVVIARLERFLAESARIADESGAPRPTLVDVSQNDWGGPCECSECLAATRRTGTPAGLILEFVNGVADAIHRVRPDALVMTLAYQYSFEPPRRAAARDNVVVRLSGFGIRDYARAATDDANSRYRDAVIGWSRAARHLWIWDYAVTFGEDRGLPLASYLYYADDFRFYRDRGVEGIFVQHENPVSGDLRDLKLWLWLELQADPDRDIPRLVREFLHGFYGPAARPVAEYLRLLESAWRRNPCPIDVNADRDAYVFIDLEFVNRAQRLFDRAEAAARRDPALLRRVRHARISLDFATLARWTALIDEAARRGRPLGLDPRAVAERYREASYEQIEYRLPEAERAVARAEIEDDVRGWRSLPATSPVRHSATRPGAP